MKKGFTLVELIFVIVVLGILAAIAIPRFGSTATDAHIAKGRSDISSIRAAIVNERQSRLLRGQVNYAASLDGANTDEGQSLFGTVLATPIISANQDGRWMKSADNNYTFQIENTDVDFGYDSTNGSFTCARSNDTEGELCKRLID